jgi:acetyl esterase/lipase
MKRLRIVTVFAVLAVILAPRGSQAQSPAGSATASATQSAAQAMMRVKVLALLKEASVYRDVPYATVSGTTLLLDLFVPKDAAKPVPLVIWIHGGGLVRGDKASGHRILPLLPLGYAVASINYRLAPAATWPAQLYDCKAAVRWLRAHAAQYGLDPNRIAVGGDSSGGHLASLLGTTINHPELEGDEGNPGVSSSVKLVLDFFGPSNLVESAQRHPQKAEMVMGATGAAAVEKERAASTLTYVDAHTCPFYIAHGDQDKGVPLQQSLELDAALKKAGVPEVLHVVRGKGHEFVDEGANQGMIDFLRKYLSTVRMTSSY